MGLNSACLAGPGQRSPIVNAADAIRKGSRRGKRGPLPVSWALPCAVFEQFGRRLPDCGLRREPDHGLLTRTMPGAQCRRKSTFPSRPAAWDRNSPPGSGVGSHPRWNSVC